MPKSLHPLKRAPHLRQSKHLLTPRLQRRILLRKLNARRPRNLLIRKGYDRDISYCKPVSKGNVLLPGFVQSRFKDTIFLLDGISQDVEGVADGGCVVDFEG